MKKTLAFVFVLAMCIGLMGCEERQQQTPSLPPSAVVNATILRINDSYKLFVSITLPNPCHKIEYKGLKVYGNEIFIYFEYTPPKPNEVCIQKLEVYTKEFDLGKFARGEYVIHIVVNGKDVKTLKFYVNS